MGNLPLCWHLLAYVSGATGRFGVTLEGNSLQPRSVNLFRGHWEKFSGQW